MDNGISFIDRKEDTVAGNEPSQITPKKKDIVRITPKTNISNSSNDSASSEPPRTPGKERSELNIEIKGYRETNLTPKSKITSDKVRTVFRSSGGSSSDSKESVNSPVVAGGDDEDVFSNDVSSPHRTPTQVIDGGVWYLHRKTSESHYISQQYNVDATSDSPSKSVSAIPHVTFKTSKAVRISGGSSRGSSKSSTSSGEGDRQQEQSPRYSSADHLEKRLAGSDSPNSLNSPSSSSATSQFLFDALEYGTTLSDGKLDSDREDVQQIIQSTYLVSDISDVIDDNAMKTDAKDIKPSSSTSLESSVDAFDKQRSKDNKPSHLTLDPKSHDMSSSRSAYSPGLAIRSYALEELAEKKKSPVSAKAMRFDSNSSKIDIDSGTSVDNAPSLKSTDSLQQQNILPETISSLQSRPYNSYDSSSPFKITKVNKVHLPDHKSVSISQNGPSSMTEEERLESEDRLDSLVDINAIQAAYRFHDVGMMMTDVGGICNPAFDDDMDDDVDSSATIPETTYRSSENLSPVKSGEVQKEIVVPVMSASQSSTLSSTPSSVMKSPGKQTPNTERHINDTEITQQILPASSENMVSDVGFLLNTPAPQAKKPDPVPFTRKFSPTKKFDSTLKSLGARLLSESLIVDVYYDTASFDLTLKDSWLRTRNGKWQFHSGFTTLFGKEKEKNYQEIEDVSSLISGVNSTIGLPKKFLKKGKFSSVAAFVHRSGLREYVRYTSIQKSYELDGMTIDLDMPQHGYWVGEITSMAKSQACLYQGVKAVDDFWKKSGVQPLSMLCA